MDPRTAARAALRGAGILAVPAAAALLLLAAPAAGRVSSDDAYDSFQWYRMARYRFEQRRDVPGTVEGLDRALKLDPDNAEARGFARYLTEKHGAAMDAQLAFSPAKDRPVSQTAQRWYDNALDAFRGGDLEKALYCIERARQSDPTWVPVDLLERRIREQVSYLHFLRRYQGIEFEPPKPPEEKRFVAWDEGLARAALSGEVAVNPDLSADWLGLAAYLRDSLGDFDRAETACRVALRYEPKSKAAARFLKTLEERRAAEAERKRRAEEAKAAEAERARREAEEKSRRERTQPVREVVAAPEGPKIVTGANEFFDVPFWDDAQEADGTQLAREVPLGAPAPDTTPAAQITAYVAERFAAGKAKYAEGLHHEALLEYEKAYLRVLAREPEDVRALFNLVLIYGKLDEKRAALEHFMRLLSALETNALRDGAEPAARRVRSAVSCWMVGTVVQSAWLGYNASGKGRMTRQTFVVSKLRRLGYLDLGPKGKKVRVKLSGPLVREREIDFFLEKAECPSAGAYSLDANHAVRCSVHGVSPLITEKYEFDALGK